MRAQATVEAEPARDALSAEVRIAFAPDKTYLELAAGHEHIGVWRMLRRPLIVLVVIATAVPIMAVQRITLALFAFSTVSFGFVVLIQMVVGAAIIASAPTKGARDFSTSRSRRAGRWQGRGRLNRNGVR